MEIFSYPDVAQMEAAKAGRLERSAKGGNFAETALRSEENVQKPERVHHVGRGLKGSHVFLLTHPQPAR